MSCKSRARAMRHDPRNQREWAAGPFGKCHFGVSSSGTRRAIFQTKQPKPPSSYCWPHHHLHHHLLLLLRLTTISTDRVIASRPIPNSNCLAGWRARTNLLPCRASRPRPTARICARVCLRPQALDERRWLLRASARQRTALTLASRSRLWQKLFPRMIPQSTDSAVHRRSLSRHQPRKTRAMWTTTRHCFRPAVCPALPCSHASLIRRCDPKRLPPESRLCLMALHRLRMLLLDPAPL